MALKKRERKPDNIQIQKKKGDALYKIQLKNLQLYKNIHQRKRLSTQHQFEKINEERKLKGTKNSQFNIEQHFENR
jgi:hypothetical protein